MRDRLDAAAREAVSAACEEVREAQEDDHVDGVVPGLVVRPASTEQVSEVMRASAAHGLTVVPRGRGTKLAWGLPPESADVLLDVSRLDQVLDHQAGDLIVHAQAGTRLEDLQSVLSEQGQRLLLDETAPGATVGGTLATNASGPQRQLAGTARDLLIGITVVRADGVVAKAGGRVVKNVAGYDVGKLMIGSFGTLAIVTETLFRLHPSPPCHRWLSVEATDPAQAHDLAQSVVHAQVVPAAVEVDQPVDGPPTVTVQLSGKPEGVEGRVSAVDQVVGGAKVSEQPPAGWGRYPWLPGETGLKLTCRLSGVGDVLAEARALGARVRGSAGTGVLHAAVEDPDVAVRAVARLRSVCARHGGTAVVVEAPTEVKQAVDVWGPVAALELMRRVKDQFDPGHRLAPGRFVGGI